jgi:hypothetical protein
MSSFHQKVAILPTANERTSRQTSKTEQDLGAIILKTLQKKQAFFWIWIPLLGIFPSN